MTRRIWVIADDYGLAPGVNDAILALIAAGRLSGTSCMTGFAEWESDAARLKSSAGGAAIGLHLTLTDQPALGGRTSLSPDGRLPPFARLAAASSFRRIAKSDIHAELDAQHDRFVQALGKQPDFVDGHQHVHFLPVVRDWLRETFAQSPDRPKLRGAPAISPAADAPAKVATIAALALGFDSAMRKAGFEIVGPLAGIYDWRKPLSFEPMLKRSIADLPDGGLFMCHPGKADAVLKQRDAMLDARPVEFETLLSPRFAALISGADVRLAGMTA
jgi:chitin disaccharide deacetylase